MESLISQTILLLLILFFLCPPITKAQSLFPLHVCNKTSGNYTQGSSYESNLKLLLNSLASNTGDFFYNTTSGTKPNEVYGLIQCKGKISTQACQRCADAAVSLIIQRCPNKKVATIYYEECWLHYADYSFFSTAQKLQTILYNRQNMSNSDLFARKVKNFMSFLKSMTVSDPLKFSTQTSGDFFDIYGYSQCTRDLSEDSCSRCLQDEVDSILRCCSGKQGAQALSPSCYMRYEIYKIIATDPAAAPPKPPASGSPAPTTVVKGNTPPSKGKIDPAAAPPKPPASGSPAPTTVVKGNPPPSKGVLKKAAIAGATTGASIVALVIVICCYFKRKSNTSITLGERKTKNVKNVEAFLKEWGSFAPTRYKFSDVKKITNSFEDKIGEGGYGTVFKGKLPDEKIVAVKVLSEIKGDGDDFINEVASICRTSHVNIVRLLGFCVEGVKRALIYEFMHNGSLEKFIYDETPSKGHPHLGWQTLYKIATGIARGLEYLHRGCNTRILHFDIKPHNILLDQDFSPKIADFGLSKLSHGKESRVSMTGARGTPGYIAPEVIYRDIGDVSHKSDVYSYGMMVLEMVGGRRNFDANITNNSETYFPHWIYTRLGLNEDLGLHDVTSLEDHEVARKMILVGLWCIQIDPSNRPPMSRMLEMLEGRLEALQIPPKPFFSSHSRIEIDVSSATVSTLFSSSSGR